MTSGDQTFSTQLYSADTSPYLLHVNSIQRSSGNSSDFRMLLTFPLLYARKVSLLAASIPNSFYVFNGSNNNNVRINSFINFIDSSGTQKTCNITNGTYDITSLMAQIKLKMELVSPDTYTLTFNSNTLKLTITSTSALFTLLWGSGLNASNSAWYELGFNQSDTSAGLSQLSPRSISISGPLNIFIQISSLKNVIKDSRNFQANFCVPLDVPYGQYKYFKENSEFITSINLPEIRNITYFQVNLLSDFGPVFLEGCDWSCLLRFE
jgi:hypothetical protein